MIREGGHTHTLFYYFLPHNSTLCSAAAANCARLRGSEGGRVRRFRNKHLPKLGGRCGQFVDKLFSSSDVFDVDEHTLHSTRARLIDGFCGFGEIRFRARGFDVTFTRNSGSGVVAFDGNFTVCVRRTVRMIV